jgi:hypothetical protein
LFHGPVFVGAEYAKGLRGIGRQALLHGLLAQSQFRPSANQRSWQCVVPKKDRATGSAPPSLRMLPSVIGGPGRWLGVGAMGQCLAGEDRRGVFDGTTEAAIRKALATGMGILKAARTHAVGTVWRSGPAVRPFPRRVLVDQCLHYTMRSIGVGGPRRCVP